MSSMKMRQTSRYFWVKYSLVVILFLLLLLLMMTSDIRVGLWLLLFLGARSLVEPIQIHWLSKKGKLDDLMYLTKRNKLNVIGDVFVIIAVIILYVVLIYRLFTIGSLTLPVLIVLTVFIAVDAGHDFFIYYRLRQNKGIEQG